MDRFEYEEPIGEDQIRIIELLPGSKEDELRCNLTSKFRQDTDNTYDAISYAWGSSKDRPWFSCVWVVQEAGLAKECQLIWGNQRMDLAELIEFSCFYDERGDITRLTDGENATLRIWRSIFLCVYRTYNNATSWRCTKPLMRSMYQKRLSTRGLFLDIAHIGKCLSATDARDHVYAFLGSPSALSSEGKLLVETDYDKSEGKVYFETACVLLANKHEAPYVLCFVQHSVAEDITGKQGPSWIPRWKKADTGLMPLFTIGNLELSHRAGGSPERLQYRIENDEGEENLILQGFVFDWIDWTSDVLKTENFALNQADGVPDFDLRNAHISNGYGSECQLSFEKTEAPRILSMLGTTTTISALLSSLVTKTVVSSVSQNIEEHSKRTYMLFGEPEIQASTLLMTRRHIRKPAMHFGMRSTHVTEM